MSSTRSSVPRRARPVLSNPRYGRAGAGSKRSRAGLLLVVVFVLIVAALAGGGGLYWSIHQSQSGSSRTVMFHVGPGDTVTTLADRLQRDGLIQNSLLFRVDARLRGLGSQLKVGDYPLRGNMSVDQTVTALTVYHAKTIRVTIPEGFRIEQTAQTLLAHGINGQAFLKAVDNPSALRYSILRGIPRGHTLEGYLFPNTYDVPPHYGGAAFARDMVAALDRAFTPAMRAQAAADHMTIYQVLTLASIVEREARVPSERPVIASVYLNRMNRAMGGQVDYKLQADPTVQYVVGTRKDWWPLLSVSQLQTPSPYNTYVNAGLPPGPICSPGLSSIRAVLYPKHTHYLYFVAKGHGRHAFAATYQQQLANQQRYSTRTP